MCLFACWQGGGSSFARRADPSHRSGAVWAAETSREIPQAAWPKEKEQEPGQPQLACSGNPEDKRAEEGLPQFVYTLYTSRADPLTGQMCRTKSVQHHRGL